MKNLKNIVAILVVLLIAACQKEEQLIDLPEKYTTVGKIAVNEDSNLLQLLQTNNKSLSSGRSAASIPENIQLDNAIKVHIPSTNTSRYTLFGNDDELSFQNYVINETDGEVSHYVISYKPDINWFLSNYTDVPWNDYTGTATAYSPDGTIFFESYLENGLSIEPEGDSQNGRTNGCTSCSIELREVPDFTSYSGYTTVAIVICNIPPDARIACGGGGGSNPFGGETIDGGGDGSGGYDGGSPSGDGGVVSDPTSGGGYEGLNPIGFFAPGSSGSNISMEELALARLIHDDPFALIDIDCDQIENWQDLAQAETSETIKNKINELQNENNSLFDDWAIQTLNGANGTVVNMDYFSVDVSTLPNDPITGSPFSAHGFLDYFRRNIDAFTDGSTFAPYCQTPTLCIQETDLWNSNDPEGAIIYIDIPGDDGVVVCSEYTDSYWYFMTLEAPGAGNHPVSGTRQFGFEPNGSGGYSFFVRGVDRFDSNTIENTLYMGTLGINPLFGADNLWESFQNGLSQFVNLNGGSATTNDPVKNRPDWEQVKDVLEGTRPISDLGCDGN